MSAKASNLKAMASNLRAIASLEGTASNLRTMASTLEATAPNLIAKELAVEGFQPSGDKSSSYHPCFKKILCICSGKTVRICILFSSLFFFYVPLFWQLQNPEGNLAGHGKGWSGGQIAANCSGHIRLK